MQELAEKLTKLIYKLIMYMLILFENIRTLDLYDLPPQNSSINSKSIIYDTCDCYWWVNYWL